MLNFENKIVNELSEGGAEELLKDENWTFEGKDAWEQARPGTKVKFRIPGQIGERKGEVIDWARDKKDNRQRLVVQEQETAQERTIEREQVLAVFDSTMERAKKMSKSYQEAMPIKEREKTQPLKVKPKGKEDKTKEFKEAA
ncbi:hypothetical protein KKF47_00765 [Patescibacteria group bacterium]|nr:hypothetical protein [Patescibacteria group bacterium]